MEERLDDAINVLRNHAESQLVLGQLPPNLGPQMTSLGYAAPPADPHLPDPVKVERATYNTSKILFIYLVQGINLHFTVTEKRKEPPDSDTKPSSSVESVGTNSTSATTGGKSSKRARR